MRRLDGQAIRSCTRAVSRRSTCRHSTSSDSRGWEERAHLMSMAREQRQAVPADEAAGAGDHDPHR